MPSKSKAKTIASKIHPSPRLPTGRGSRAIVGFNSNGTRYHIPTRKVRKSAQSRIMENMNVRAEAANVAIKIQKKREREQRKILKEKLPNDLAEYIINMIRIYP